MADPMTDHDEHPGFDAAHRGATFRRFDFTDAVFDDTYLVNAHFKNVALKGARITGAQVVDVEITGEVERLTVNGVDVTEFVEAELDRREPDRAKMRPPHAGRVPRGLGHPRAPVGRDVRRALPG